MALTIHILVLRGCTPIVPVGLADMLRKTALLDEYVPGFPVRKDLQVRLVSSTRHTTVECAGGLRLGCDETLSSAGRSALVLVPAVDPPIEANLEPNAEVVPWLARAWQQGAQVASACTGAFLLAEAGLLSGRSATTHWAFADAFARRYPTVRLQPMAVLVDQGRLITAGGATSYLSLAVYLVERLFGPQAARLASRLFLVDPNKAPQSAYAVFATQRTHGDASILQAQDIIERELAQAPSVEELARRVAMSRRNFVRRFKQATGNAPRRPSSWPCPPPPAGRRRPPAPSRPSSSRPSTAPCLPWPAPGWRVFGPQPVVSNAARLPAATTAPGRRAGRPIKIAGVFRAVGLFARDGMAGSP